MLRRAITFLLMICTMLLLIQCTHLTSSPSSSTHQSVPSPFTMPASAYLALAKNQTGTEQQSLYLMAAGREIYSGHWREGLSLLSKIGPLPAELSDEKTLLLAKVDLLRGQPRAGIARLAHVGDHTQLPLYYQVQYHEMLASAYQALNQGAASVHERIKLDALLPDATSKLNNQRALWLSLSTLPLSELNTMAVESNDHTLFSGWINLALISRSFYAQTHALVADIAHWQATYLHHPAQRMLPTDLEHQQLPSVPKNIALLLPVTGPLAGPGTAIQDGFMAAYEASGQSAFIKVQTYDTNIASVAELYKNAVTQGADFIVGPLSKPDVAVVAAMAHPVPTLLLNDEDPSSNAYAFGLSPSNEARQVAVRAGKQGLSRALVFAPSNAWGDDVLSAFSTQWQAQNGVVVDTLRYDQNTDLNTAIRTLLHVSEREKQSPRVEERSAEPMRREDFDMIFMVAYPSQAQQIVPLLKYYYAGNIPMYATSNVYTGTPNTLKDRDLDGLIFCDVPWMFQSHTLPLRNWPEPFNVYPRLYALGMDSYALSHQLSALLLFPALGINDGVVYFAPKHHIMRVLVFGQFKQGLAQRI